MATALVYGWYGRGNAGDELMKHAIAGMLRPRGFELSFVDKIGVPQLLNYDKVEGYVDAVIFGGGSILDGDPNVTPEAMEVLLAGKVPVFYVGVGIETQVHPKHQALMSVARLVAARERDIPDLAFSLPRPDHTPSHPPHGLLVIPNVETVPTWADPHWKHVAWERYKDEFAQALDHLIDGGLEVSFLLMCSNLHMEDAWPASELMARMKRRGTKKHVFKAGGTEVLVLLQRHAAIVTQRYHGIILAEMAGVPYVSIDHHDKLKHATPSRGLHLPYHGVRKDELIGTIEKSLDTTLSPHLVPRQVYDDLADKIVGIVKKCHE